jgi:catechol 2,3-dioxygenase-like lactoylglutathione lyase family enzyme
VPDAHVPALKGGQNIAMKVPQFRYAETVRFYAEVLGLPLLGRSAPAPGSPGGSTTFAFGDARLWLDPVPGYAKADLWLQVVTDDHERARAHVAAAGTPVRDELDPLGDFPGHWISDPAGTVLLLSREGAEAPLSR